MILLLIWQKDTPSVLWLWLKLELAPQGVFSIVRFSRSEWKAVVLEAFTESEMISLWSFNPSLIGALLSREGDVLLYEDWSLLGGVAFEECAVMKWWQDVCMTCALGWRWFRFWWILCASVILTNRAKHGHCSSLTTEEENHCML